MCPPLIKRDALKTAFIIIVIIFSTFQNFKDFIQEITKTLPNSMGVSFINKNVPRLGDALFELFDPEAFHTKNCYYYSKNY